MKVSDLLHELLKVSEKSANIARIIRREKALLDLLVEEKTGDSKNKRFVQDFKTLADVLVQEVITYDLRLKFPSLASNIRGEESNSFTNALGESVIIELKESVTETAALLGKVLDGNAEAAELLAQTAHASVSVEAPALSPQMEKELSEEQTGIWIDPIDSTAQYIEGNSGVAVSEGSTMYSEGLQCAVVLIGAFDMTTGQPVMGVINQPFCSQDDQNQWHGRSSWSVSLPDCLQSKISVSPVPGQKVIAMSGSEDALIQSCVSQSFSIQHIAGAGYKILSVIEDNACAYLLSKGSTFKWDTCAPHSILTALGGGIVDFNAALTQVKHLITDGNFTPEGGEQVLRRAQLKYADPDDINLPKSQLWSNSGGLLAYKEPRTALDVLRTLC